MKEVIFNNKEKEAWSGLAKAIIYQAKHDISVNRTDIKAHDKRSAEAFFKSDWYLTLLDLASACDRIDSNNMSFINELI